MRDTPAPWRPRAEVELLVGTPPGGGQDRPARALMYRLQEGAHVDMPMRLVNVPGRGGGNAWDLLQRRAGDPHVLSVSAAPLVTNRVLGAAAYDHAALTPIAMLYTEYPAFVVPAGSAVRDAAGLLARLAAGARGLTVAFATAVGTASHIALARVARHAGGDPAALRLRVFESALDAVADVLEGHAEAGVVSAVSAADALAGGGLRAVAVSSPGRLGGPFADVPTWRELSVPCEIGQWRGIVGAPGIAAAAIGYWERALAAATAGPEWAAELERCYWTPNWMDSETTRAFLDSERDFLGGMLRELGLTASRSSSA